VYPSWLVLWSQLLRVILLVWTLLPVLTSHSVDLLQQNYLMFLELLPMLLQSKLSLPKNVL